MKKIDESPISASVGLFIEKKTVQHLQDAYTEAVLAIKSLIPDDALTTKLVILSGCVATGTGLSLRTLTAGVVYYNGEIFQVPAASFTPVGAEIAVWKITDIEAGTNESTLTDNSMVHALVDRKFIYQAGVSGSGTFDEGSSNIIKIITKTDSSIPSVATSAASSMPISSFELARRGNLCSLFIAGSIIIATGDVTGLNTGAGYITFELTIPAGFEPSRTSIGGGIAFANVSGSPYKPGQVYSEKVSPTKIYVRFNCIEAVVSGDNFVFVLNSTYVAL